MVPGMRRTQTWPHLRGPRTIRYTAHGYPQIDTVAACGRQIAVTLTANRLHRVRCPECISAVEADRERQS